MLIEEIDSISQRKMPEILLWRPVKKNGTTGSRQEYTYGHATLSTQKYHMSYWPNDDLSSSKKLQARAILPGCSVDAGLVFHDSYDNYLEADKEEEVNEDGEKVVKVVKWNEEVRYTIACATDEDIDRYYEDFLRRNGIDPATVTKAKGKEMIDNGQIPVTEKLSKSQYRFTPFVAMHYESLDISILVGKPQNCTSFCFHLIEMAKRNQPRVIISDPSNLPVDLRNFEACVKKYYLADSEPPAQDSCHIL